MTPLKGIGGLIRPGYEMAVPPVELAKLPGFGPDVAASRAEARRLLAEAGMANLQLKLLNRVVANPYQQLGIFIIDQLRQIGVSAEQTVAETPVYFAALHDGNFDIAVDPNSAASDDPTDQFLHFLPGSPTNYSHNTDPLLTELFERQKRTVDPVERQRLVSRFERTVIEQAYFVPLFWNERIVALASNVKGWHVTPVSRIGLDLGSIWLSNQ